MTDNQVISFIRDRFNTLENNVADGFKELKEDLQRSHTELNKRITSLETERNISKGKALTWATVGGTLGSGLLWLIGRFI